MIPQHAFYKLPLVQKVWTPPALQSHDFFKWTYRITCIGLIALSFLVDVSTGNLYRLTIGNWIIHSQNGENQKKFLQAKKEVTRNRRITLGALAIGAAALAAIYLGRRYSFTLHSDLPSFLAGKVPTIPLHKTSIAVNGLSGSNSFYWIARLGIIGAICGCAIGAFANSARVRIPEHKAAAPVTTEADGEQFSFCIKTLSGNNFIVKVNKDATVLELKKAILPSLHSSETLESMRLIFAGKILEDRQPLSEEMAKLVLCHS